MVHGCRCSYIMVMILLQGSAVHAASRYGFNEVWAYLMKGEEKYITGQEQITDLCYFSARVNDLGRLEATPISPPKLPKPLGFKRRTHLVISAPASKSLMYFCLNKNLSTREGLLQDIVRLGRPFDGVQVDFEAMRPEERSHYVSFLIELKRRLGSSKMLSVALPARTELKKDAFDYRSISSAVDKVLIMAYDEHWRTGAPGPIASLGWSEKVARFSSSQIRNDKLVIGLPLYGRIWQKNTMAKALKYPETLKLWESLKKPTVKRMKDQVPYFEYSATANLAVYWEDQKSLGAKLLMYQRSSIRAVGFWRIGQGPAGLWSEVYVQR